MNPSNAGRKYIPKRWIPGWFLVGSICCNLRHDPKREDDPSWPNICLPFGCLNPQPFLKSKYLSWLGFESPYIIAWRSSIITQRKPWELLHVSFNALNKKTLIAKRQRILMDANKPSTAPKQNLTHLEAAKPRSDSRHRRSAWTPMILSMSRRIAFGCGRRGEVFHPGEVWNHHGYLWSVSVQRVLRHIFGGLLVGGFYRFTRKTHKLSFHHEFLLPCVHVCSHSVWVPW